MAENVNKLTLQFIDDYKNLECLWNANLKAYRTENIRNEALRSLDKKYGLGGIKAVKNKIKSLRSYFAKEHRKYLRRSRSNEAYVPPWFAYKHLLFLKDTYTQEIQESMAKGTDRSADAEEQERTTFDLVNDEMDPIGTPTPSDSFTSEVLPPPHKKRKFKETKKRSPEDDTEEEKSHQLTTSIASSSAKPSDEYSAFGEYVGHKIRNLPSRQLRSIAQHRISNILFDLEMSPVGKYADICSSSSSSCSDTDSPPPLSPIHGAALGSQED